MSIGSVIASVLPLMRRNAESLMTDSCTIDRITTEWVAGVKQTVVTVIHADVPCHVETSPAPSRVLVTDQAVSPETPLVRAPYSLAGVQPDDRVTVAGRDPMWVTHATLDDPTHPVELLIQCRRTR